MEASKNDILNIAALEAAAEQLTDYLAEKGIQPAEMERRKREHEQRLSHLKERIEAVRKATPVEQAEAEAPRPVKPAKAPPK